MARDLNKTRMRDTRILMALTVFAGFFCSTFFPDETPMHESMDLAGYILATTCAIGRIYSTAFIGGIKNEKLITWGPYSLCRNPLYFFSLVGAAGIGLMTTSVLAFIVIFTGFYLIYDDLIRREEEFLAARFGAGFAAFKASTPRLLPKFGKYHCPDELPFQPRYLTKAVFDAVWWFAPLPLFEFAEYLHEEGIVTPLFRLF